MHFGQATVAGQHARFSVTAHGSFSPQHDYCLAAPAKLAKQAFQGVLRLIFVFLSFACFI